MTSSAASGVHFGVYVHVPYCQVQCPYCTFYTVPRPERRQAFARFLAAAGREWRRRVRPRLRRGDRLRTLYMGGGTPSDVPADLLDAFLTTLAADLPEGLGGLDETTVECNPESVSAAMLETLRGRGVDRISLGVQSLHADDLRRLGRASTVRQVHDALAAVGRHFDNWSADLIVGIVGADRRRLETSLATLQRAGAPHVSFYCLELPAARARAMGGTPWSEQRVANAYLFVSGWLERAGYEHYEISSAARPGKRARHNHAYWQRREYVGLGPGAHSYEDGTRRANKPDLQAYLQALEAGRMAPAQRERLTPAMIQREELLLGLRQRDGVDVREIGLEPARRLLDDLERQGLGRVAEGRFALLPRGWLVSDSIVLQLVTFLDTTPARVDKVRGAPLHST